MNPILFWYIVGCVVALIQQLNLVYLRGKYNYSVFETSLATTVFSWVGLIIALDSYITLVNLWRRNKKGE
jgi:hypothetical protein